MFVILSKPFARFLLSVRGCPIINLTIIMKQIWGQQLFPILDKQIEAQRAAIMCPMSSWQVLGEPGQVCDPPHSSPASSHKYTGVGLGRNYPQHYVYVCVLF